MSGDPGRSIRRGLAVLGALAMSAIILVSAEQARPAATALGETLGLVPLAPRLAEIADTIAVRHRIPSPDQLAFARRAAVATPLAGVPYYIVGATGGRDTAPRNRRLIALALRRDPRLRPAWAWTVADRIKAGDVTGITRALIRLAVLTPENEKLWPAIAQISAAPQARALIKAQIRRDTDWQDRYLTALSASTVDRAIVFEMVQSVGKHVPVATVMSSPGRPDDRRDFLAVLMQRKEYERAYLAWIQWLPAASLDAVGHVFDGGFKGAVALPPFTWQLSDGAGGSAGIAPATGLTIDYAGTDGATLASQLLLLAPGRYRVTTEARFASSSNDGVAPLVWELTCQSDQTALTTLAVPLDGTTGRIVGTPFDVPAGCVAQTLALKVNSAEFAKHLSGQIRNVSVEAVK